MNGGKQTRRARFRPGWLATAAALALCGLALGLAGWQLERADQKRMLQDGYIASQGGLARRPEDLVGTSADDFVRVRLAGTYDGERQFLVDNRTVDGRPGYLVVTPFTDGSGHRFLVERGWVPAPVSRSVLPEVPVPSGTRRIEAVVWPDTGLPPLLDDDPWVEGWPKRVQRLNMARLGPTADVGYPFALRLEAGQPGMLRPLPTALGFHPERHEGYAAQWLALGILVAVIWTVVGVRRG